jgi:hypothetical protein
MRVSGTRMTMEALTTTNEERHTIVLSSAADVFGGPGRPRLPAAAAKRRRGGYALCMGGEAAR